MLASLESELSLRRDNAAARNIDSVRAVLEHLYLSGCDCPAASAMFEDAARDVLQVALNHSRGAQGPPVLWTVVLKHMTKLAELTAKIDSVEQTKQAQAKRERVFWWF